MPDRRFSDRFTDRTGERRRSDRGDVFFQRSLGSPRLFAIIYTPIASAIYFSLGVVADHALGLTPFVFLAAGLFFALTAMTYVEGASLHQDRGGATVFARYAFNELSSFVAGWAILLDYVILIAVSRVLGDELPAGVLGPLGRRRRGDRSVGAGDHRAGSRCATSAASRPRRAQRHRGHSSSPTSRCRACSSSLGLVLFFDPRPADSDRSRHARRPGRTSSSR